MTAIAIQEGTNLAIKELNLGNGLDGFEQYASFCPQDSEDVKVFATDKEAFEFMRLRGVRGYVVTSTSVFEPSF